MNRQVKYARMQTGVYIPGLAGELGTVFPPSNKTLDNLTMVTTVEGLHISFIYKNVGKELLIPYANVALMDLLPEEPKPTKVLKTATAA